MAPQQWWEKEIVRLREREEAKREVLDAKHLTPAERRQGEEEVAALRGAREDGHKLGNRLYQKEAKLGQRRLSAAVLDGLRDVVGICLGKHRAAAESAAEGRAKLDELDVELRAKLSQRDRVFLGSRESLTGRRMAPQNATPEYRELVQRIREAEAEAERWEEWATQIEAGEHGWRPGPEVMALLPDGLTVEDLWGGSLSRREAERRRLLDDRAVLRGQLRDVFSRFPVAVEATASR